MEIGLFISFDIVTVLGELNPQHFCLGVGGDTNFPVPPASAFNPQKLDTDAWLAVASALGLSPSCFVGRGKG